MDDSSLYREMLWSIEPQITAALGGVPVDIRLKKDEEKLEFDEFHVPKPLSFVELLSGARQTPMKQSDDEDVGPKDLVNLYYQVSFDGPDQDDQPSELYWIGRNLTIPKRYFDAIGRDDAAMVSDLVEIIALAVAGDRAVGTIAMHFESEGANHWYECPHVPSPANFLVDPEELIAFMRLDDRYRFNVHRVAALQPRDRHVCLRVEMERVQDNPDFDRIYQEEGEQDTYFGVPIYRDPMSHPARLIREYLAVEIPLSLADAVALSSKPSALQEFAAVTGWMTRAKSPAFGHREPRQREQCFSCHEPEARCWCFRYPGPDPLPAATADGMLLPF